MTPNEHIKNMKPFGTPPPPHVDDIAEPYIKYKISRNDDV